MQAAMQEFLKVSLKIEEDIKATVKFFKDTIDWEGWTAATRNTYDCSILIKQKIEVKERFRKDWLRL
jgi:hypothetical protein